MAPRSGTSAVRIIATTVAIACSLPGSSVAHAAQSDVVRPRDGIEILSDDAVAQFGLRDAGVGTQWVMVTEEARRDGSFDPRLGQSSTVDGTYREFVLVPKRAQLSTTPSVGSAAACKVSTYHSGPHRVYYSHAHKYGPRSYAWGESSAGCRYSTAFTIRMRENHGYYKPTVGTPAGEQARPGGGRVTVYTYYSGLTQCETYFSTAFSVHSERVRVCP